MSSSCDRRGVMSSSCDRRGVMSSYVQFSVIGEG